MGHNVVGLIHFDICEPTHIQTQRDVWYFVLFIDIFQYILKLVSLQKIIGITKQIQFYKTHVETHAQEIN